MQNFMAFNLFFNAYQHFEGNNKVISNYLHYKLVNNYYKVHMNWSITNSTSCFFFQYGIDL